MSQKGHSGLEALKGECQVNWIRNVVRPRINSLLSKRDTPDNLWIKCPKTGEMVFHKDLEANLYVVPNSGVHLKLPVDARFKTLFVRGEWEEIEIPDVKLDPLRFRDERRYTDRLKDARYKANTKDAVRLAYGTLDQEPVTAGVQDFGFLGGSLGMGAGEGVVKGLETALERKTPFVMFTASGGARMQEGILSLMQMPRTTVAVRRLREAGLPYIVVLTHPTTGGVTASYAMLGDVHIAEPDALICFAGPRVIEQTIREKLPEGFQRAEYLRDHGMVDMVVSRLEMRSTLSSMIRILMKRPALEAQATPAAEAAAG